MLENRRHASRLAVMKAIRRHEPVARTELAELVGVAPWALTEVVGDFVQAGLLREERSPSRSAGRPRVKLKLNADAAHIVAAYFTYDARFQVDIANLRGDKRFGLAFPLLLAMGEGAPTISVPDLVEAIALKIDETIRASPVERHQIRSVGVNLPGLIDSGAGVLHWLPYVLDEPAPLAELLQARLELPIALDSMANALVRGEHWFGPTQDADDFALIFVGLGMGAGEYRGGELRHGSHGFSSEIAHVKVSLDGGPACMCGARGCLMTYASFSGIAQRIADDRQLPPGPHSRRSMLEAYRACADQASSGEEIALAAFRTAGKALGLYVANFINQSDPRRIKIIVADPSYAQLIDSSFRETVSRNAIGILARQVLIEFGALDDVAFTRGAAALALDHLSREPARFAKVSAQSKD